MNSASLVVPIPGALFVHHAALLWIGGASVGCQDISHEWVMSQLIPKQLCQQLLLINATATNILRFPLACILVRLAHVLPIVPASLELKGDVSQAKPCVALVFDSLCHCWIQVSGTCALLALVQAIRLRQRLEQLSATQATAFIPGVHTAAHVLVKEAPTVVVVLTLVLTLVLMMLLLCLIHFLMVSRDLCNTWQRAVRNHKSDCQKNPHHD
mmetsp:Transcript_7507/g.13509  ORF Transcript_7507/g.13509 Transcript_7507/m.13509 type:complete len:212 (+) Transcript_7507:1109-1744(+)